MNEKAFLHRALENDEKLARWFYLLGVKPEQFTSVFKRPEYKSIESCIPKCCLPSAHLRDVLAALTDEDVQAFIKIPKNPDDDLLYGILFRKSDSRRLFLGYNAVDGITAENKSLCPELDGAWYRINKHQRDALFRFAKQESLEEAMKSTIGVSYEPIGSAKLTPNRLKFLASITKRYKAGQRNSNGGYL